MKKYLKFTLLGVLRIGFQNVFAISNPASDYCVKNGGNSQIKTLPNGGEYGICVFEENRQCEERAMYNGACPIGGKKLTGYDNDADKYCAIRGNNAIASDMTGQSGTCKLTDGTSCSSYYYYTNNSCSGASAGLDVQAKTFCANTQYSAVYTGMGYIKVVMNNMGGGIQYYTQASDGTYTGFSCPVVAPNYVSQTCKDISQMSVTWSNACAKDASDELQKAVSRMHDAGFTKYSTISEFLPDNLITRQEASKFLAMFAKKDFAKVETSNIACFFNDTSKADSTLKSYITSSCELGLLKGDNSRFFPTQNLTRAQAIVVLTRLLGGELSENIKPWWMNYYNKILEKGILSSSWTADKMEKNITRGELATLIYRLYQSK